MICTAKCYTDGEREVSYGYPKEARIEARVSPAKRLFERAEIEGVINDFVIKHAASSQRGGIRKNRA
jgi:hypothetical protein